VLAEPPPHRPERAEQLAVPVAVAAPGCLGAAIIPASPQSRGKLFFEHVFNEAPDALTNPSLQRIKPIRTQRWNLDLDSDIICRGVISSGGANRRVLRLRIRKLRLLQISTIQATRPVITGNPSTSAYALVLGILVSERTISVQGKRLSNRGSLMSRINEFSRASSLT